MSSSSATNHSVEGDVKKVDFELPGAVLTPNKTLRTTGVLLEVTRAGSSSQKGGEEILTTRDEPKSSTVFVNKESDGGEEVEIVLPNAGLISDIVQTTGPLFDVTRAGSSTEGGGEENPFTRAEAQSLTVFGDVGEVDIVLPSAVFPSESASSSIQQVGEEEFPPTHAGPKCPPVVLDLASPETKASISLDQPKQEAPKRPFDCLRRGKVETMPSLQPGANLSNHSLKNDADLASRQSEVKGGPEEPTSKITDNLRRKKAVELVLIPQCDADLANPDGKDDANLAISKTDICLHQPDVNSEANAKLQMPLLTVNIGLKGEGNFCLIGGRNPGPKVPKNPGPKVPKNPAAKVPQNPAAKVPQNPGPKSAGQQRQKKEGEPSPKGAKEPEPKGLLPKGPESFSAEYELHYQDGKNKNVFKGIHKADCKQVTIKRVELDGKKDIYYPGYCKPLPTEVALMLKLKEAPECPYVIKMLDWYEERNCITLVLEYLKDWKDLHSFIDKKEMNEDKACYLMLQLVRAAEHCLNHRVFHGDIQSGNILVDESGLYLKLTDFGMGRLVKSTGYTSRPREGALQKCYNPPEALRRCQYLAMPATVWGLGIVLYEMMHGIPPFPNGVQQLGAVNITRRKLTMNARDLIRRCLYMNPDQRLTIDQILAHPWFRCIITQVPATPMVANNLVPKGLESFNAEYKCDMSDFLGSGAFGRVYKGFHKADGKFVAIKRVKQCEEERVICYPGYSKPLVTEVALMLKLQEAPECPYVIKMIDWYEEPNYLMLVLEYLEGWIPLCNYRSKNLPEDKARCLMLQLVRAVEHCLKHGVSHNDIHFRNIMVDKAGLKLKLIDFGIGRLIEDAAHKPKGHKGAPEKYSEFIRKVMPKNVLALGIALYRMLHGKMPILWTPIINPTLTKNVRDLIQRSLNKNAYRRLTIKQILDHEWFKMDKTCPVVAKATLRNP